MTPFDESLHPRNKGKFADKIQSEATNVTLGGGLAAEAPAQLSTATKQGTRLEDYVEADKFVEMAKSSATYWQHHYNQKGKSVSVDVDDIAQETIARVLEHVKKGNNVTDFRQLVSSTAANVTVRSTENQFRAEDRKAYRIFDGYRTTAQQKLNRNLTQVEEDVLAQKVLDEWDKPRHRPSKDFRTPRTIDASLDKSYMSEENDGGRTLGSSLVAPERSGNYIEPDSFMDRAHTALETTGAAYKAEAKRLAWNAIAERADAPLAQQASLSQRQVTKHRGAMDAYAKVGDKLRDPVVAACKDWSKGDENEATEAMFAPFGNLNIDDQEKVVEMFERFGEGRAQTMWESAVGFSNNKHSKEEAAAS
jgi:hypothetical protein